MKKLMCVLILVAFIGSMVVMTGCFGGSSGIGAIIGGALVIAIIAGSGGGGAVVFAANTRASERPAIMAAASGKRFRGLIKPTGQSAVEVDVDVNADGNLEIADKEISANSTNGQYSIEIYPADKTTDTMADKPIYQHVFVQNVGGGEKITYPEPANKTRVIASDTAEAQIYESWDVTNKPTIEKTAIAAADINALSLLIQNDLENIPTVDGKAVPDDTFAWTAPVTSFTPVTALTRLYSISGFVTKKDGTGGQDGATVYAHGASMYHSDTIAGNYTVNVPQGTYQVFPSSVGHTYIPAETEVVITESDVTGINFQAQ